MVLLLLALSIKIWSNRRRKRNAELAAVAAAVAASKKKTAGVGLPFALDLVSAVVAAAGTLRAIRDDAGAGARVRAFVKRKTSSKKKKKKEEEEEEEEEAKDASGLETIVLRARGIELHVSPFGATVTRLLVPDKRGRADDVVLGYDALARYDASEDRPYFGAVVGRCANRIADASFSVDGATFDALKKNNGNNCLHGGGVGFDRKWWTVDALLPADVEAGLGMGVRMSYVSRDGEEGFPGTATVSATYRVVDGGEWRTEFRATTTKPTPMNLAQHSYFNLRGHDAGVSVDEHEVRIRASGYTPVDPETMIPLGSVAPTTGAFDLRDWTAIGARPPPGGYDHNFALAGYAPDEVTGRSALFLAAEVRERVTGRRMEVWCDQPGVQFYAGNFVDARGTGKGGATYGKRGGLCLETQHFPDAVNQPNFRTCVLRPGETYSHSMTHKFFAE